ncbi:MAG: PAS domain S-box protein [Candidatus Electryonea clarkiae]|nr:PAS domain S-box protein [Candidatus Electryonea clarkiae]MDP8285769.1 PAS domain S-box protein [Candidatus Electryonea clarkiae]
MSIRIKILSLPFIATIVFVTVFIITLLGGIKNGRLLTLIETEYFQSLELSHQLEKLAVQTRHILQEALTAEEELIIDEADTVHDEFLTLIEKAKSNESIDQEQLSEIESIFEDFYNVAGITTREMIGSSFNEELLAKVGQMHEKYSTLMLKLSELTQSQKQKMEEAFENARKSHHLSKSIITISFISSLALIILLSFAIIYNIIRPVRELIEGAEAISEGDLYKNIDYYCTSKDEMGRLADSFRKMQSSLIADIERRELVEEHLMESEERYRSIFENATMGIFRSHPDGHILTANNSAATILGYKDSQDVIENITNLSEQVYADSRDRDMILKMMQKRGEATRELLFKRKDGTQISVKLNIWAVMDNESKLRFIEGFIEDITDRKQIEKELSDTQKKLLESAHSAGMAEIATSVLYNVGNALNGATTSTSVLRKTLKESRVSQLSKLSEVVIQHEDNFADFAANNPQGKKLPKFLGQLGEVITSEWKRLKDQTITLDKSHDHIRQIIALQQNYAGVDGVMERVILPELVNDAVQLFGASFERHHIKFNIESQENLEAVAISKHRVLQIMINLLKNARDAVKEVTEKVREITVWVDYEDDVATIRVADNGSGIAAENLEKIFGYGFTTKEDGHGYGLHGCANSAREMGGSLTAKSNGLGKGATFILTLPIEIDEKINA